MDHTGLVFKVEIQQIMYIAGETQDPSMGTLALIEDIIQKQVVQMLRTANELASRRGSRVFSNNDILFQFRHNTARIERLRTFLTWKAIRRTVKDSDDKDPAMDEVALDTEPDAPLDDLSGGKSKLPNVTLPWDVSSFFSVQLPDNNEATESLSNKAAIDKLHKNDERTRDMSVAEYAKWSEYRHASFTWRKAKRFREWSGLGVIAENKPNDDVLDILGYLTSEMVQDLTAEALAVRRQELQADEVRQSGGSTKKKTAEGLFTQEDGPRSPVTERHVGIAFQKMQTIPKSRRALLNGTRQPSSTGLRLI